MSSLRDSIKAEAHGKGLSTVNLMLEQKFNKLFFLKPNSEEESKLIYNLLTKNGFNAERAGLHASAIIVGEGDFCYREQVLSLLYKRIQSSNIPSGLKRIFEEGNYIHEKWQRLFIRGELGAARDMDRSRFNKRYELSYTPDAIIDFMGEQQVVEIKSMNTFQFKHCTSHPSGKKQLMMYMHLTGIHKGFVLVEDKNTQDFKIFMQKYDATEVEDYVERLEAIRFYKRRVLEEGKMVKGICSSRDCKRAQKCDMRDACFNCGVGRIKL